MWQRCPICNGSGIDDRDTTSSVQPQCSVCNGMKIISETTGLPLIMQVAIPLKDENDELENK